MDGESWHIQLDKCMLVHGLITKFMVPEYIFMKMEVAMKENSLIAKEKDMEFLH